MKKSFRFNLFFLLLFAVSLIIPCTAYGKTFKVKTVNDLMALKNAKKKDVYILKKDIDLSSIENWEPFDFKGKLDGKNHIIKNLKSTKGGLFENLISAKVKNLRLNVDIKVLGLFYTGGLANHAQKSSISKCIVSGSIDSTGISGGYFAKATDTKIKSCVSSVNFNTGSTTGGFVGDAKGNMLLSDCLMLGKISKESSSVCGGIAGEFEGTLKSSVTSSNSLSADSKSNRKGSIVAITKKDANILDCYYYGNVAGLGPDNREYQSVIHLDEKYNNSIVKKFFVTGLSPKKWIFNKKINKGMPVLRWASKYIKNL